MDLMSVQRRLDAVQRANRPVAFVVGVAKHTGTDRGSQLAALVAYYGFFSLFPLLLVLVTFARVVLAGDPSLQDKVIDTALDQVPVVGSELGDVGSTAGSGWILLVGTVVALWAGLGVLDTVQDIVQRVWEIPPAEQTGFLSRKLRSLSLIVVFGVALGLVMAIGVAAAVVELPLLARLVTVVLTFILASAVALTALVVLGGGGPPWRDHIPGALLIGLGWVLLQLVGTWVIDARIRGASSTYGTFAVVLGILLWLTILGWLVVLACEINVVRSKRLWPVDLFDGPVADEEADMQAGTT